MRFYLGDMKFTKGTERDPYGKVPSEETLLGITHHDCSFRGEEETGTDTAEYRAKLES